MKYVLPYPAGNIHPRFWGWVIGTGTVSGAFAELLSASMNSNTGGLDHHSANHVEKQLILWLQEIFHFPASASGVLTSGEGQLSGIERADSLALDLHKWMYMPYEIGCVLLRSEQEHRNTFSLTPAYLAHGEGGSGLTGGDLPWFSDYGFQLSRGFRALKAWMSLKEHGIRKYGRLIELQEGGIAVPSGTTVRGLYYFHLAITNHRSRREDFDLLLEEVLRIGGRLQRKTP